MAKEILDRVREVEDQAAVLRRVAEEKAAEIRTQVEREGATHCAETEQRTEAEYKDKLETIRARTEALRARKRAEAEAEASALAEAARAKMDEAADLIVWGLIEKCR